MNGVGLIGMLVVVMLIAMVLVLVTVSIVMCMSAATRVMRPRPFGCEI